ncbi:hypothetical protein [Virgibacillus proomii]|uniref:hypothetical protein n=1 Tax=Virgibacillus proomii TaxID=84407 RepID=UPI0020A1B3B3
MLDTIHMLNIGKIEDADKIYVFARDFSELIGTELTIKLQLLGKNCEMPFFPEYEVRSRLPLQVLSRVLLDSYVI